MMKRFASWVGSSAWVSVVGAVGVVGACGGATETGDPNGPTGPNGGASSSGSNNPAGAPSCDGAGAANIVVTGDDPNGYPPYAVADCTLVYVNGAGALVIRNLVTNAETVLAEPNVKARRPAISIDVLANGDRVPLVAWETLPTTAAPGPAAPTPAPTVRVRYGDAAVKSLSGDFVHASEPRVSGARVVFTAWKGATEKDDMDVWVYDARTDASRLVVGGAGQQRFADISATHVAVSDFSEDPDGRYDQDEKDLADIVLYEIASSAVTRRPMAGKQAFPMLTDNGVLAYLAWSGVHPEPKLQAYDLKAGPLTEVTDPGGAVTSDRTVAHVEYITAEPVRPSVSGNVLEWVDNPEGTTSLHRATLNATELAAPTPTPTARVSGLDGLQLYAPAATRSFTVLATIDKNPNPTTDRTPRLRTVAR